MDIPMITDRELANIGQLLQKLTGIPLAPRKKHLVVGRLNKRLRHYGLSNYTQYFELVSDRNHEEEMQVMVDLLTTNETYFFREPVHFEFLSNTVLPELRSQALVRAWSAASSSGEEAYSLAMVMRETLGARSWEILGSDINLDVLDTAGTGIYPFDRVRGLPTENLHTHCLKGVRTQEGTFSIKPELKDRVKFRQINLNEPLPDIGTFDIIMLRNVLIYFDVDTKQQIVARVLQALKPGGYFFISHAETLHNISTAVKMIKPSIFRKSDSAQISKGTGAPCP